MHMRHRKGVRTHPNAYQSRPAHCDIVFGAGQRCSRWQIPDVFWSGVSSPCLYSKDACKTQTASRVHYHGNGGCQTMIAWFACHPIGRRWRPIARQGEHTVTVRRDGLACFVFVSNQARGVGFVVSVKIRTMNSSSGMYPILLCVGSHSISPSSPNEIHQDELAMRVTPNMRGSISAQFDVSSPCAC